MGNKESSLTAAPYDAEAVCRIAGFIVLGGALIAVSFLYQYCKKKGFFKPQSLERSKDKDW